MLVVNTSTGNIVTGGGGYIGVNKIECDSRLELWIQIIVIISYLHLFIYSWVFLGDTITWNIPIIDKEIVILTPFRSLRFLMFYYFVEGVVSFIFMCITTFFFAVNTVKCHETAPILYLYTQFVIGVYWTGFTVVILVLIEMKFGKLIMDKLGSMMREPTVEELEEKIFRKKFAEFDKDKVGYIQKDDLPTVLTELGVYVPDEELPDVIVSLDPKMEGNIKYDALLEWFKKMNERADDEPAVLTDGKKNM